MHSDQLGGEVKTQEQGRCSSKLRGRRDDGSALILSIFAGALCLAVALGVANATSMYIERKRLFNVADGMALAAADNYDFASVTSDENGPHFVLSSAQVRSAAQDFYRLTHVAGQPDARIISASSFDGTTAHIEVETQWVPPVLSLFFPQGFPIRVSAQARTIFTDGLPHR